MFLFSVGLSITKGQYMKSRAVPVSFLFCFVFLFSPGTAKSVNGSETGLVRYLKTSCF